MDIVTIPWLIGFQPSQIAAAAIGGILHMDPKPKGVYAFYTYVAWGNGKRNCVSASCLWLNSLVYGRTNWLLIGFVPRWLSHSSRGSNYSYEALAPDDPGIEWDMVCIWKYLKMGNPAPKLPWLKPPGFHSFTRPMHWLNLIHFCFRQGSAGQNHIRQQGASRFPTCRGPLKSIPMDSCHFFKKWCV